MPGDNPQSVHGFDNTRSSFGDYHAAQSDLVRRIASCDASSSPVRPIALIRRATES